MLLVDSLAAAAGGAASASSNTTFIESAAGVSEGGRTGLTAVVVGVLFLLVPVHLADRGRDPSGGDGALLVIVGYFMMTLVKDIDWSDPGIGIPALLTIDRDAVHLQHHERRRRGVPLLHAHPGAAGGSAREVHPLMYIVAAIFAWYFVHGVV